MQEKENILRILEEAKESLRKNDTFRLKELSDQTVHTSSISQDPDNIAMAVTVYSLSKILERKEYQSLENWGEFSSSISDQIDKIINAIKKDDEKRLKNSIEEVRVKMEKFSGNLKDYIQDVFRKAQINKASKIYEHGISMEKTANLLGITLFDLANYAGQKLETPTLPLSQTIDVKSRIKIAMDIFK